MNPKASDTTVKHQQGPFYCTMRTFTFIPSYSLLIILACLQRFLIKRLNSDFSVTRAQLKSHAECLLYSGKTPLQVYTAHLSHELMLFFKEKKKKNYVENSSWRQAAALMNITHHCKLRCC